LLAGQLGGVFSVLREKQKLATIHSV
jgi:hypothetical protein